MRQSVISTKGRRAWQGIPTIERAANGRLWCAFFSGGPREPSPDNHILLTTSGDDGITWSAPSVIVAPAGATRAYDPALWHDPEGGLWLFYNQANLETRDFSVWAIRAEDADSAYPHWSAPRRIELGIPFAFRLNKPTVLTSGEWLLPVTWARAAPSDWFAGVDQMQGSALSCDAGATWTLYGEVMAPAWALENMVVDCGDGRLWMLIRTGDGVLWESFSYDCGRTWGPATPTHIVNPGTRFFIRRLASGRLLLINTPHPRRREGLLATVGTSVEELAMGRGLLLDGRDRVSYPDAVEAPGGVIYTVHDHDRYGSGEIILSIFLETDALAGDERLTADGTAAAGGPACRVD